MRFALILFEINKTRRKLADSAILSSCESKQSIALTISTLTFVSSIGIVTLIVSRCLMRPSNGRPFNSAEYINTMNGPELTERLTYRTEILRASLCRFTRVTGMAILCLFSTHVFYYLHVLRGAILKLSCSSKCSESGLHSPNCSHVMASPTI
jgi:hypothetical protein